MRIKRSTLRRIINETLVEARYALVEDEYFDSYDDYDDIDSDETDWAGIATGVGGALAATNVAGAIHHRLDKKKKKR